jgi:CRP-like cAMP-binding protein
MATEGLKWLQKRSNLPEADRRILASAFGVRRTAIAREDVIRQGDCMDSVTLLVKGCACAHISSADGRRQIVSVLFPGDFCDLSRLFHRGDAFAVRSLTPCVFVHSPPGCLKRILLARPAIAAALLHECVLETAIQRAWLCNLGRSSAHTRTAHLLCEFYYRGSHAGLAHGSRCPLPLTQADMADALGLSVVQVNRVLQSFRRSGLLSLDRGILQIRDMARLADIGAFSPTYLAVDPNVPFPANSEIPPEPEARRI